MIEDLIYWCREREEIRKRKLAGRPAPWTDDPILTQYRFCNVRRRDDRVSAWLRENVLTEENIEYNLRSFLMFSAWCRYNNWPPTIAAVLRKKLYPRKRVNWEKVGQLVDQLGQDQKAWTSAYMIRAGKKKGAKKGTFVSVEVIQQSFGGIANELVRKFQGPQPRMEEIWEIVCSCPNFGSFMSGQVVADWSYTSLLRDAPDYTSWAPQGPGSIRGFNRMLGITPITKRPLKAAWDTQIAEWRTQVVAALGEEYQDLDGVSLNNILCETDKFLRVRNEEGRPRAKYKAHDY